MHHAECIKYTCIYLLLIKHWLSVWSMVQCMGRLSRRICKVFVVTWLGSRGSIPRNRGLNSSL